MKDSEIELPSSAGSVADTRPFVFPPATANRLGLYLRELQHYSRSGILTIKSHALGNRLGLSDSQIRRDLSLLGEHGRRGVGYNVSGLVGSLRKALGTDGVWNVILIGFGNLGNALARYRGFGEQGFVLQAVFDADDAKVETPVAGVPVFHIDHLEAVIRRQPVHMAILAVPAEAAPGIAERLSSLGVAGILNFSPVSLSNREKLAVVDVDLAIELQRLAFAVVNSEKSG